MTAKLVKKATVKAYPGASPGLHSTHNHHVNTDVLAFIQDCEFSARVRDAI
jgi:hypothetical protein